MLKNHAVELYDTMSVNEQRRVALMGKAYGTMASIKVKLGERNPVLMIMKKTTWLCIGAALILVIGVGAIFATSQAVKYSELPSGAFEEQYSPYSVYGLEYIGSEYDPNIQGSGVGNLYYNGQLVETFVDRKDNHDILRYEAKETRGITVYTIYDSDGTLTGLEQVN